MQLRKIWHRVNHQERGFPAISRYLPTYVSWIILALPGVFLLWQFQSGTWTYGYSLSLSGKISVWLLLLTLTVTPARRIFGARNWIRGLIKMRRAFGVASFAYAVIHLWLYLQKTASLSKVAKDALPPDLLTGWVAMIIFLVLAITSNNKSVRKLGRQWQNLHRMVYIASMLVIAHWVLTAFDPQPAYIHGFILAALLAARLFRKRAQ